MLDMPGDARANDPDAVERPQPQEPARGPDSDRVAGMLRALAIPHVELNPGASFRGPHDALAQAMVAAPAREAKPARG